MDPTPEQSKRYIDFVNRRIKEETDFNEETRKYKLSQLYQSFDYLFSERIHTYGDKKEDIQESYDINYEDGIELIEDAMKYRLSKSKSKVLVELKVMMCKEGVNHNLI